MSRHSTGSSLDFGAFLYVNYSQVTFKWLKKQTNKKKEHIPIEMVRYLDWTEKHAVPKEKLGETF